MSDDVPLKVDIHSHILPRSLPDLEKVSVQNSEIWYPILHSWFFIFQAWGCVPFILYSFSEIRLYWLDIFGAWWWLPNHCNNVPERKNIPENWGELLGPGSQNSRHGCHKCGRPSYFHRTCHVQLLGNQSANSNKIAKNLQGNRNVPISQPIKWKSINCIK